MNKIQYRCPNLPLNQTQAIIRDTILHQFCLLRSNIRDVATVLADKMNGEVPAHQAQEQGIAVGVGGFTSPVSADAAGICPVPTSAEASRYKGFGYKQPIV